MLTSTVLDARGGTNPVSPKNRGIEPRDIDAETGFFGFSPKQTTEY